MKLSIIIPIYKAERWMGRCLDSLFSQGSNESDFEVICIVDGSPDNSSEIIKEYKRCHSNIVLIEQKNQGVSVARNNGIQQSKGEYITFLDSDDVLLEKSLSALLNLLKEDAQDLIVCRSFVNKVEWPLWNDIICDGEIITPGNAIKRGFLHGSVWGCCYKRKLIRDNAIKFPIDVSNGEDNMFFLTCMYYADIIKFSSISLYQVIEEENSLSRSFSKQRVDKTIKSLSIVDEVMREYPKIKDKTFILQYIKYTCLSGLVMCVINTKGVGLLYLLRSGVTKYCNFALDNNVVFMRRNMELMKFSFSLFYLMSWGKHKILRK